MMFSDNDERTLILCMKSFKIDSTIKQHIDYALDKEPERMRRT